MPRGPIRIDPKNTPRQRHFDQQVADILNALVMGEVIVQTPDGWGVGDVNTASNVLMMRSFNFQPRYGQWGD